jgi:hypothetical protein
MRGAISPLAKTLHGVVFNYYMFLLLKQMDVNLIIASNGISNKLLS